MSLPASILREIFGLFVDDGALAWAILGVVAAVALLTLIGLPAAWTGPTLLAGCALVLVGNVVRTLRRRQG